jgi:hypothetical protein
MRDQRYMASLLGRWAAEDASRERKYSREHLEPMIEIAFTRLDGDDRSNVLRFLRQRPAYGVRLLDRLESV